MKTVRTDCGPVKIPNKMYDRTLALINRVRKQFYNKQPRKKIASGVCNDVYSCPISSSIMSNNQVETDGMHISLYDRNASKYAELPKVEIKMPEYAEEFVERVDRVGKSD